MVEIKNNTFKRLQESYFEIMCMYTVLGFLDHGCYTKEYETESTQDQTMFSYPNFLCAFLRPFDPFGLARTIRLKGEIKKTTKGREDRQKSFQDEIFSYSSGA
jgi:hypothetical protein